MTVVRTLELDKTYRAQGEPVNALRGVSFSLAAGEMVALRGPSGCGKSSLVALLACADRPTAGRLEIAGRSVTGLSDRALRALRRRAIGIVFQEFHLLDALRVRENVALPLVLLGTPRLEIAARVEEALALVELVEKSEAYPAELSGGQQQRVAIARALVHRPALVLADEPTGNLDSRSGANAVRLLREAAHAGAAVLVATHASEVAAACDRELNLSDGVLKSA